MQRGEPWRLAAGVGLAAALAFPALAADHKYILPEAARSAPAGQRALEVEIPQAELSSNINPSMVDVAMGGGVLGVIIDAKIDNDRAKRAQAGITPVRDAISDFDADQLGLDTTQALAARVTWLQGAAAPGFGRDTSPWGRGKVLDAHAANAGQVVFLQYTYDTSPDFASIRVGLTITVANTAAAAGAKPDSRLSNRNLVYIQTVTSVVSLSDPKGAQDNAARWAAGKGSLARRALTLGFQDVAVLAARAADLKEADLAALTLGQRRSLAGVSGRLVEEGPNGTLLFNNGFAHVQVLHD